MRDHISVAFRSLAGKVMLWVAGSAAVSAQTPTPDANYRQGSEWYRAGNCPEAVRALSQSKGTPRASLLLGRCYLEMGNAAKARESFEHYNQAVPGDEDALILQARASDAAPAVTLLEGLHQQAPASLAVDDALGDAYVKSGKLPQATTLYQSVLAVQPSDVGALWGLAGLDASAAQWAPAAAQYRKLLAVAPDNIAANVALGQALLQLGQMAGAIPYLQRAARLRPDDWPLSRLLGEACFKTDQWAEAVQALEYNSLSHADDEEVTGWMVQAYSHTGDSARAGKYYQAVLQRAAGNFTARMKLADLLYDAKRPKEAREQYVLVLKAKPDLFEISDRVGQISEQEGNIPEAIQYYSAACASPQATTAMKLRLARLYFRTGDMEHARPGLETALKADPDNREIKTMLTQVATKTGHMEDAVKYATDLLTGDPNNVELLRLLGEDSLKHDKDMEAADYLERAFVVEGKNKDLRFELVGLYTNDETLDRLPRAFDLMNEYVGLNPEDYEGYLLLANLYRRKSDPADAREYFTRGFNKMPAKPPARISWAYNSLGLLLFSEGNFEEALANQLKAVELNPNDANSQYNLALTYLKLKRKDEVNAARERLSQMNSPELLTSLDEQILKSKINGK